MRFAWLVIVLGACGDGNAGDTCRSTSECGGGLECVGPVGGPVCGIPPREACASDAECGGERCHAIVDPCSADGIGSECRAACTGAECGEGFTCEAGACVAVPCTAGYACEPRQTCEPVVAPGTPVHARHHGCIETACATDATCGERVCVNGICQDGLGACREPVAVP